MLRFSILVGEKLIKGQNSEIAMSALDELTDWTENYIKNKDLLTKSITSIQRSQGGWNLVVIRDLGLQEFLIMPHLESAEQLTSKMQPDTNACLVVLNTKANLDVIVKQWSSFVKFPKLCIIFANPNSNTEKRWIIVPYAHDKITERRLLRAGLDTLFGMVEPYVEK